MLAGLVFAHVNDPIPGLNLPPWLEWLGLAIPTLAGAVVGWHTLTRLPAYKRFIIEPRQKVLADTVKTAMSYRNAGTSPMDRIEQTARDMKGLAQTHTEIQMTLTEIVDRLSPLDGVLARLTALERQMAAITPTSTPFPPPPPPSGA